MAGVPADATTTSRRLTGRPDEWCYWDWMTRGFPQVGDILFTTEAPLGNAALVDIALPFAEKANRCKGFLSGRYWVRTSDLCRVKAALYR
jgi:hypothetical protein